MRNLIVFIFAIFLAGCSLKPQMPKTNGSFEYKFESSNISDKWWQEFNDENLNSLIQEALNNNIDLKIAYLNLEKSELFLKNSKAELFPSLGLNGSAKRAKSGIDNNPSSMFSLNAMLNYEIDLWGRVKNSIISNNALLKSNEYDINSSRLSIAANVADAYMTLVALKMQEQIYNETLASYENTMSYRKKQFEASAINESIYLQSVAATQSAKIGLTKVKNAIINALNSLLILTSKSNNDILKYNINTNSSLPKAPQVNADISSDILLKRSDVASAYEKIKSQNALIGVAKAAYFPTLSLTGLFGFSSNELDRLFMPQTNAWSIGGSLAQSLFDYGKRSNNVKLANISQDIAVLNYEKAVKTALSEVKSALEKRKNMMQILKDQDELLKAQSEIYRQINAQYEAGYIDHLNLLDAQRNLLNAKLNNIEARLSLNQAIISIYKAFGGGFKTYSK